MELASISAGQLNSMLGVQKKRKQLQSNKTILIGTKNPVKIEIIRIVLDQLKINYTTLKDLNIDIEIIEDGCSTEENAKKKAKGYFIESQLPTIAIDGGLTIEGLKPEKQPGQHIRRIDGKVGEASDEEIQRYYIDEVKKLGGKSIGVWSATIALAVSSKDILRLFQNP